MSDTKNCATCGAEFHRGSKGRVQFAGQRFCSVGCVQRTRKPTISSPYRQTKIKGRRVDLHRAMKEKQLGRRLGRFEFVHHVDEDKQNNALDNLEVVTPKEHAAIHQQKYPLTKECECCGKTFTPKPTKRKRAKTCSQECRWLQTSRKNRNPEAPNSMYGVDPYPSQGNPRIAALEAERCSE